MKNSGLGEAQAGIKIDRRNISNFRYADDTTPMAESEEELKSLLKVKEESEKGDLKVNILKTKVMASGPITSCKSMGKQWKQWQTLFWGSPKSLQMVTVAMKLKDSCFSWKKNYDQPRQLIKGRDITLPTKVCIVFPVVVNGCELDYKERWVLKNWCF